MDAKKENSEVCVLKSEDSSKDDENGVDGSEIFRLSDDFGYYAEKIRKGVGSIKGRMI